MTTIEDLSVMVHYAPGDRPLCGSESLTAITTEEPALVRGCQPCGQEAAYGLAAETCRGRCLYCREGITAEGGVEWRQVVRGPCPHCHRKGW